MVEREGADVCSFCRQATLVRRSEELTFHQLTDQGWVFCRVTVPMGICNKCGAVSWDEATEAIIEDAVRTAYEKLG